MNIGRGIAALLLVSFSILPATAWAQEHPEHPEHSEHPEKQKAKAELTIQQLSHEINHYVTEDAQAKGGFFMVYDPVAKKPLALTLDHVHEERLSALGGGVYFACADFTSADGKTYDVDVFMKETGAGLETTEVHIHKVDGKPRYSWKEESGLWVREDIK